MKAELLLLIPSMVDVDEHISAADELLKCLTAAPDARFLLDQPLKMPAVVALSALHPLHESLGDRQRVLSVMLAVRIIPFICLGGGEYGVISVTAHEIAECPGTCVNVTVPIRAS